MSQDRSVSRTDLHRSLITRRQVLRVGLSLAALPLFAACAQPSAPAPTAAPAKPAETAEPAGRRAPPRRPLRRLQRPRRPLLPSPPGRQASRCRASRCRQADRHAQDAALAGDHHPQPAPLGRAPRTTSRRACCTRAADDGRQRGRLHAGPGGRGAQRPERRRRGGRQVRHLQAEAGHQVVGRPAVLGRRRGLHLAVRHQQGVRRRSRSAPTPRSTRWRRSTRTRSRSPSRSRPAAGSCRSSATPA